MKKEKSLEDRQINAVIVDSKIFEALDKYAILPNNPGVIAQVLKTDGVSVEEFKRFMGECCPNNSDALKLLECLKGKIHFPRIVKAEF